MLSGMACMSAHIVIKVEQCTTAPWRRMGGQRREVESTSRPHHRRRQHRHVLSRRVLQFGAARRVEVRSRSTRRTRARAALGAVRPRAPGAAASRGGAEHIHEPGAAPGAQLERARSCVTRARALGSELWATEAEVKPCQRTETAEG